MIEFRALKVKEYRAYSIELSKLSGDKKPKNVLEVLDSNLALAKLQGNYITSWDFKDETGTVLPLPQDNPDVYEELTNPQLAEIFITFNESQQYLPKPKADNS